MYAAKRQKILALGLDAGDLDYLASRRRHLPTFSRWLEHGRIFRPAAPKALSGSVWPTFYTGKPPGEHGIYQHLVWDAERMGLRRIGTDWCAATPFWQALEESGADVIAVDVPYSFPGFLQRGVAITDWGTHGQTFPTAGNRPAVDAFLRAFGPGGIGRETPVEKSGRQLDAIRRSLIESAGRKGELISGLLREFPWDLCVAVFGESHRAGHTLYTDDDEDGSGARESPLLDVYRAVDRALARILESVEADSTGLLLFSVHGMRRDNAQGHLVRPLMRRINGVFLGSEGDGGGLIRRLRRVVPARLQHAVGAAAPDRVRQWVVEREIVGGLDWARTPGFALRTDIRTELRLNLRGRERDGILDPRSSECARYVDLVKETFAELRDAERGAPLVDEVVEIPQLFPGRFSHRLPDLVVTWRDAPAARVVRSRRIGSLTLEPAKARGGDHTDSGFAALMAPHAAGLDLPPLDDTWQFAGFLSHLTSAPS